MALSSDNEFHAAAGTTDGTVVGRDTGTKVGFFGTAPIARPNVPATTPTVQQVITALVALGLITQSD